MKGSVIFFSENYRINNAVRRCLLNKTKSVFKNQYYLQGKQLPQNIRQHHAHKDLGIGPAGLAGIGHPAHIVETAVGLAQFHIEATAPAPVGQRIIAVHLRFLTKCDHIVP